jgi:hypothetical protein
MALAKAGATEYSWEGTAVLDLFQSFELDGPPANGAEVFSLIRRSPSRQPTTSTRSSIPALSTNSRAKANRRLGQCSGMTPERLALG